MPATLRERLIALIEPLVGRLGYELVELEYAAGHAAVPWCASSSIAPRESGSRTASA